MDNAQDILRILASHKDVSDQVLAEVTRKVFGDVRPRSGHSRSTRPFHVAPSPAPSLPQVDSSSSSTSDSVTSAAVAGQPRAVRPRLNLLDASRQDPVRVNVRIDGRRTSLSFAPQVWKTLETRFGGKSELSALCQELAVRFSGRGNRSAWVLDELELELHRRTSPPLSIKEGQLSSAAAVLKRVTNPHPGPSSVDPSAERDLFSALDDRTSRP